MNKTKTVLITRQRHQAQPFTAALERAGLKPILLPNIKIRCLEDWTSPDPDHFFTSVNAVHCCCDQLRFDAP
jgi:uroporphyrinogen-III synthase